MSKSICKWDDETIAQMKEVSKILGPLFKKWDKEREQRRIKQKQRAKIRVVEW